MKISPHKFYVAASATSHTIKGPFPTVASAQLAATKGLHVFAGAELGDASVEAEPTHDARGGTQNFTAAAKGGKSGIQHELGVIQWPQTSSFKPDFSTVSIDAGTLRYFKDQIKEARRSLDVLEENLTRPNADLRSVAVNAQTFSWPGIRMYNHCQDLVNSEGKKLLEAAKSGKSGKSGKGGGKGAKGVPR